MLPSSCCRHLKHLWLLVWVCKWLGSFDGSSWSGKLREKWAHLFASDVLCWRMEGLLTMKRSHWAIFLIDSFFECAFKYMNGIELYHMSRTFSFIGIWWSCRTRWIIIGCRFTRTSGGLIAEFILWLRSFFIFVRSVLALAYLALNQLCDLLVWSKRDRCAIALISCLISLHWIPKIRGHHANSPFYVV